MTDKKRNGEIDLMQVFYLIMKHKKRIIFLAITGLILGSMLTGLVYLKSERTPRHVLNCSFAVVAKNSSGAYSTNAASPGYNDMKLATDIAESVLFVVKSDRVLSAAIEKNHFLGIGSQEIRKYLQATQYSDTQIVTLELRWENASEGLRIIQSICDVIPEILIETLNLGSVSLVDFPKDTGIEAQQIQWKYIFLIVMILDGGYIGILFLKLIIHPTISDVSTAVKDLKGLECIGIIPENERYFHERPFSLDRDEGEFPEVKDAFVSSAYVISNLIRRENYKCLYFTSSESGEGKTGVVANIAIQLAQREHKVLVVDMDIKRPALGSCFLNEIEHRHSLNAVYEGEVSLEEAVVSAAENLDILATRFEKHTVRIDNLLRGQLKTFFERYDIVLLDAPPIGIVSETASLNRLADKAIMVVKFDTVWVETILKNIEKLNKTGIDVCGSIITNVNRNRGNGYHDYYQRFNSYHDYYSRAERDTDHRKKRYGVFGKKPAD